MTHLGQRLSALIDGELDPSERERVLYHVTKCPSCREEVAALRMLKRRMNALGDGAASAALSGLNGRLMDLSRFALGQHSGPPSDPVWPGNDTPDQWHAGHDSTAAQQRNGKFFLAGSLAIFLAGLGTAAFIAGGEPQPNAPAPPVTPSVDVLVVPRTAVSPASLDRRTRPEAGPIWGTSALSLAGSAAHR